jgi:hypothetical protein
MTCSAHITLYSSAGRAGGASAEPPSYLTSVLTLFSFVSRH